MKTGLAIIAAFLAAIFASIYIHQDGEVLRLCMLTGATCFVCGIIAAIVCTGRV